MISLRSGHATLERDLVMSDSRKKRLRHHRRLLQFSLVTLLLATAAFCVLAYFDPLSLRLPSPVPIHTYERGDTAGSRFNRIEPSLL